METAAQPSLFDRPSPTINVEELVLYALGEFQARGHRLADRELALDRLHGAFARASLRYGIKDLPDEDIVRILKKLGAVVLELPTYVAKRPYRVIVGRALCGEALSFFTAVRPKPEL